MIRYQRVQRIDNAVGACYISQPYDLGQDKVVMIVTDRRLAIRKASSPIASVYM
jgi:hypothetical protein